MANVTTFAFELVTPSIFEDGLGTALNPQERLYPMCDLTAEGKPRGAGTGLLETNSNKLLQSKGNILRGYHNMFLNFRRDSQYCYFQSSWMYQGALGLLLALFSSALLP